MPPDQADPERPYFIGTREVRRRVGLSKSTIDRRIREGSFPKPIKLGYRTLAWKDSDIRQWQVEQEIEGPLAGRRQRGRGLSGDP